MGKESVLPKTSNERVIPSHFSEYVRRLKMGQKLPNKS